MFLEIDVVAVLAVIRIDFQVELEALGLAHKVGGLAGVVAGVGHGGHFEAQPCSVVDLVLTFGGEGEASFQG